MYLALKPHAAIQNHLHSTKLAVQKSRNDITLLWGTKMAKDFKDL